MLIVLKTKYMYMFTIWNMVSANVAWQLCRNFPLYMIEELLTKLFFSESAERVTWIVQKYLE